MLRLFLEYAASAGKRLGDEGQTAFPLSTIEADVYDTLSASGIPLISQYGVSSYRIDFVARHPKRPGRLVLAIEFDGATYHSAQTARDRDRLRQQHLEALGFRFHRIWSTDWFLHREEETKRAQKAYRAAVVHADQLDGNGPPPSAPPSAKPNDSPTTPMPSSGKRTRRPSVPKKASIADYRPGELLALVRWVNSDGRLRTDEEITDEMVVELGFQRRGTSIEAAIRNAIQLSRSREQKPISVSRSSS